VQGRLTNRDVEAHISSNCVCCAEPLELTVGSNLSYRVHSQEAAPLVSVPFVDFQKLKDPSIIHAF
jgi:hypothetical protein